jgi:arabinan endo-1,5-alpha-L-arabinosidase
MSTPSPSARGAGISLVLVYRRNLLLPALCALMTIFSLPRVAAAQQPAATQPAGRSLELEYTNPVWDGYLADPHVLKTRGEYYAYGTGEGLKGRHFPVLRSRDFVNWEFLGNVLEDLTEPRLKDYWAPEVVERDGTYYLYYAGDGKMRVAVSDHPAGPFKDIGRMLLPDEPFSIDGHPFRDPKSGKWYLFFAKDFLDERVGTALAVVELGDDMISTVGPIKTVLRAVGDWQIYQRNRRMYGQVFKAWHTVEGPAVVFRDNRYYCFYSGGNWQTPSYGVGFAVSDSVTGPYKDTANLDGPFVLKGVPGELIGPGHNSVILGPDQLTWFIVYHSWNPERTRRQMCLDPIEWTPRGPRAWRPSRGAKRVTLPLAGPPAQAEARAE